MWLLLFATATATAMAGVSAMQISSPGIDCVDFSPGNDSPFKYRYCHQDRIEQFIAPQTKPILLGRYDTRLSTATEHVFTNGTSCQDSSTTRRSKPRRATVSLSTSKHCCQSGIGGSSNSNSNGGASIRVLNVEESLLCQYKLDVCVPTSPQCKQQTLEEQEASARYKMPPVERARTLDQIRAVFYHGYNAYLDHAYPADELLPLTCAGVESDLVPGKLLTLIDSMDTLMIVGNITEFHRTIQLVSKLEHDLFKVDKTISVFETTIRILGGLLSAHALCVDEELGIKPDWYDGALLRMAKDIGDRLLPAFDSPTGIPFGTVDLLRGVPVGETSEACTAAAGSLSLEFGMLSVLTGEDKYALASRRALKAIYDLRSSNLNLFGRHLDIKSGAWTERLAGIGSNIDSIYEYYFKQYVLFGDEESLEWFQVLYEGVLRHLRVPGNRFYHEVDMHTGKVSRRLASALQAFWPGLQVLAGDLTAATKTLNAFMSISNDLSFLPEDFDLVRWSPVTTGGSPSYLLRPELIESIYYVYRATGDDSWLLAGKHVVNAVIQHCYVPGCGFASLRDVTGKGKLNSMPSFFLSEWAKYAFLLFEGNEATGALRGGNWVFTTEAHPFRVTLETQRTFEFARREFRPRAKKEALAKLDDISSLYQSDGEGEQVCSASELATIESYYMAQPDTVNKSFRPFVEIALEEENKLEGVGGGVGALVQEQKNVGVLEGVGPFEIISTYNSFRISRTDATRERVLITNMDTATAMITFGEDLRAAPTFVQLKSGGGDAEEEEGKAVVYGKTCTVSILARADTCAARFWEQADRVVDAVLPCSIGDGFGAPKWHEFVQSEANLPVISFPSLCSEEELQRPGGERLPPRFYAHTLRGSCSFQEKSIMAQRLGSGVVGLLVSLLEEKDDFFIMSASSSSAAQQQQQALGVPTFLLRANARKLDHMQVFVEMRRDARVMRSQQRVHIHGFPDWNASFNVEKESGMFRIHLQRQV